jgi:Fe-S-cluster containining protein
MSTLHDNWGHLMITLEDLASARAESKRLFNRLHALYDRLPETACACDEPGACCTFLSEMTALEAMQWIHLMEAMPDHELTALINKFVEFYLPNPARLQGCPFKNDGACSIYRYRTFGCRAYALWSQKMRSVRVSQTQFLIKTGMLHITSCNYIIFPLVSPPSI